MLLRIFLSSDFIFVSINKVGVGLTMLFISSLFFSSALLFAASSSVLFVAMAVLKNSSFVVSNYVFQFYPLALEEECMEAAALEV